MNLTGLDTNVLVRFVTRDDAVQTRVVEGLFRTLGRQGTGFVSVIAIVELAWVLRTGYRFERTAILDGVEKILRLRGFEVQARDAVLKAIHMARTAGADFADALIAELGTDNGCTRTITFDRRAAATVPGMELIA